MTCYFIESGTSKYFKGYRFSSIAGILSDKYEKRKLLDNAIKTGIDAIRYCLLDTSL